MSRQEEISKFITGMIYEILEYQRGVYDITVVSSPENKNTVTDKNNPVYRATITSNGCSMDIELSSRPIAFQVNRLSHKEYSMILCHSGKHTGMMLSLIVKIYWWKNLIL